MYDHHANACHNTVWLQEMACGQCPDDRIWLNKSVQALSDIGY